MDTPSTRAPRRSAAATRTAIEAAARVLFRERGFTSSSVRDIAVAARVDPAVVIRHFGSKEHLFLLTMEIEDNLGPLDDVELGDLGPEIVRRTLGFPARAQDTLRELIRAADREEIRVHLRTVIERNLVGPLTRRLDPPMRDERAALVATQILGLLMQLWVLEDPAITGLPEETVVALYGAALQVGIDGPSPG